MMAPLSEVHNQARPARRPAVYGRKKGVSAQTREVHRQLFGTDENDIAEDFEKLTIDAKSLSLSQTSVQAQSEPATKLLVKSDSTSEHKQETKSRLQSNSAFDAKLEINTARKPKATGQKRRQPTRNRRTREMAPITPEEKNLLQPLLSSEYVHDEVISFKRYESIIRKKCTVKKLGEGSYSSAFLVTENHSSHEFRTRKPSVIKLIPFQISILPSNSGGSTGSRDSGTTVEDLLREIRILDCLTKLPGFARACGTHYIVRGKLPNNLTEAFEQFKLDEPEQAHNELSDDNEYSFYGIVEMLYAGKDLDTIKNISFLTAYDIFWMVVIYFARAERDFEFEHRDLHMSNLCYTTHESNRPFNSSDAASVFGRSGFEINIIDYTLSRIKVEEEIVWNPAGPGAGSIQKSPKYKTQQMAIWRAREWCKKEEVRAAASGDTQGSTDRWSRYLPKTNVVWLAYVLGELRGRCLEVVDAGTNAVEAMQRQVAGRLKAIEGVLDVDNLSKVPGSAEEVLDLGIKMGWIAREDVVAFGERLNSENS